MQAFKKCACLLIGFFAITSSFACSSNFSSTSTKAAQTDDAAAQSTSDATGLIQPADIKYLGAFRLPGEEGREGSFSYGGNAMTYTPRNDGSLFVMGHDRIMDEFASGNQVAEVSIPEPVISKTVDDLNTATFLQNFSDVTGGLFDAYSEIPRAGMQYLDTPGMGEKIFITFGQHFHEEEQEQVPTHAMFDPDLSAPDPQGSWFLGGASLYSVNDYIFDIPNEWADTNVGGRYLASGRFRDGGWSGQGPALWVYAPWLSGNPPTAGTNLSAIPLLKYSSSNENSDITQAVRDYQHADEWAGGAWLTTPDNRSAVIFVGTKGAGEKYWYGWVNPEGADKPCVETEMEGDFILCRLADGSACAGEDLLGCSGHNDYRGWWASEWEAQIIFYDPADLADVARGAMQPDEPQPFARMSIDDDLILQSGVEEEMIGTGAQRRFRIGSIAYDRDQNRLYILEPFADGTKPLVHVFQIS